MHRYKIVARISLILFILNLVLATPIVVHEIHKARGDEVVAAEDVPAMPEKSDELGAASGRPTSPPPSPDAIASPQHSSLSDGSTSSGYPVPHLSSDSSVSGYSWLLNRPPRLSLHPPASLHESASPPPSSPGSSEIPLPALRQGSSSLSSMSSEIPAWLLELEQVIIESWLSQHTGPGSDWATTETSSPPERFTPSHHPSSLSSTGSVPWHADESISTPYSSASDGSLSSHYFSASDGLAPSHNSISEGSPSSPPENAKFFNENMMKKIKVVAGVVIIGGVIAGIAGSRSKHHHRDCQDS
jgi:hypothetical protein